MELRGNVYANIQQRMSDINEVFQSSYENLKDNRLYTKESLKIGAIMSGGKIEDKNPAIENYKSSTLGFMALKEYDFRRYGRKANWSVGFAQTKFDFDYGSNETVYSANLGVGYEDYIGTSKRLKWHTRGEININRHETDRKIHLSTGTYTNNGKYSTYMAQWNNKVRYEIPIDNDNVKAGIFGTFDLGYGKIENIKETGDGIYLDVKKENLTMVRPGIGADVTFNKHIRKGKISLTGKVTAEYEFGKYYDGPNQAKIKGTGSDYYNLEEPKEVRAIMKVGAELKYETRSGNSIGFEVSRAKTNVKSTRYGVNFVYRFGN
jgi:hypothetical protein